MRSNLIFRLLLVLGPVVVVAGCAVGPEFRRPAPPPASAYAPLPTPSDAIAPNVPGGGMSQLVESIDIPGQWWTLFRSTPLNDLVDDALRHNADLDAARAGLRAAREAVYAQQGGYFPQIDTEAGSVRQKDAGEMASAITSNASLYTLSTAQVSVSYGLDLWGLNRRQVESLAAQADAQRFELEAAYLTLTTNLVNVAIAEASLRAQIALTHQVVDAQQDILGTLQRQQQLGDVSEAAVAAQVAALEQARASLPELDRQLAVQRDLLAQLTGRTPDRVIDAHFDLDALRLPMKLPLSVPAQLVRQRPDVRQAEAQLHAASANLGVAMASRLPNLQIDAALGRTSTSASRLLAAGNGFWSLGAGLTQPLFDGGMLRHHQRGAEAALQQAAAQYRSTVLEAVQNVTDTLHAIAADARTLAATQRAEEAAARSLDIARHRLALGDLSSSAVLGAQLAWQQTALALVQARAARYVDTVALFQALGGGWWNRHDVQDLSAVR